MSGRKWVCCKQMKEFIIIGLVSCHSPIGGLHRKGSLSAYHGPIGILHHRGRLAAC